MIYRNRNDDDLKNQAELGRGILLTPNVQMSFAADSIKNMWLNERGETPALVYVAMADLQNLPIEVPTHSTDGEKLRLVKIGLGSFYRDGALPSRVADMKAAYLQILGCSR